MKKTHIISLFIIHFYFFNNSLSLLSLSPPYLFENNTHQEENNHSRARENTSSLNNSSPPSFEDALHQELNENPNAQPPPYSEIDSPNTGTNQNPSLPPYSFHPTDQPPSYDSIPNAHNETIINSHSTERDRAIQWLLDESIDPDSPERHLILPLGYREFEFDTQVNGIAQLERMLNINPYSTEIAINGPIIALDMDGPTIQRLVDEGIDPESPEIAHIISEELPYLETINFLTSPVQNNKWFSFITIPLEYYMFFVTEGSTLFHVFSSILLISFVLNILWFLRVFSSINTGIYLLFLLVLSYSIFMATYSILLRSINRNLNVLQTLPIVIKDCIFLFLVLTAPFLFIYFSASLATILSIVIVLLVIYAFCFVYKQYLHDKRRNKKTNFVKTFLQIPFDILIIMPCFTILSLIHGITHWLISIVKLLFPSKTPSLNP